MSFVPEPIGSSRHILSKNGRKLPSLSAKRHSVSNISFRRGFQDTECGVLNYICDQVLAVSALIRYVRVPRSATSAVTALQDLKELFLYPR
jgi:hypothetical protein